MCVRLSFPSEEGKEPLGEKEGASFECFSSFEYPWLAEHLARFTGGTGWSSSSIMDALQDSQREVWGILDERHPLAFYVLHVGPFELEIEMIAVAPEYRRRGLGTQLLRHAQSRVGALGKESLLLEVRRSNHAAQCLYVAEGMQQDGVRKGYYPVHDDSGCDGFAHVVGESLTLDSTADTSATSKSATSHGSAREDALLFSWVPSE